MSEEKKPLEELMREFVPRPAPPELKRRVLAAASKSREVGGFLSRPQLRAAAVLGLISIAALAADAWFAGRTARGAEEILAATESGGAESRKIDQDLIREIAGQDRNLEKQVLARLALEKISKRSSRPIFGDFSGVI
jgi:hypothetical protein